MGLLNDIENAKKDWAKYSWFGRTLITFSVFMSVGSIASISDYAYKWKGFIKGGLNFYNKNITIPISEFGAYLGVSWHENTTHYLIICFMLFSGILRQFILVKKSVTIVIIVILFPILFTVSVVIYFSDKPGGPNAFSFVIATSLYIATPFIYDRLYKSKLSYFAPGIIAISCILVLGAINSGLTR